MNHRNHAGHRGEFILPASWWGGVRFAIFVLVACVASAQPWEPNILWQRDGRAANSNYGIVFALGDQNHDGLADWVVNGADYAEFFHGGETPSTNPYQIFQTDTIDEYVAVRPIGDVNGDGYVDWAVIAQSEIDWHVDILKLYFGGPDADTLTDFRLTANVSYFEAMGDF